MMNYIPYSTLDADAITFGLGSDRNGKPTISACYGETGAALACVTPAAVTNWPRVTGDGNFGTMWGPSDIQKAKFTLDLTDSPINESQTNDRFKEFSEILERIDDKLLDFVTANQLKILGRKNLTRDEVKMLQIRSVRPKYDKSSGALQGYSLMMSASKYPYGPQGKYARVINICDHNGHVLHNGNVQPGDVVAVTMYANQIYCGVGGDKFGIHWSFEDVQVICQRAKLAQKTFVPGFQHCVYDFAQPYQEPTHTEQFSEPMVVGAA